MTVSIISNLTYLVALFEARYSSYNEIIQVIPVSGEEKNIISEGGEFSGGNSSNRLYKSTSKQV